MAWRSGKERAAAKKAESVVRKMDSPKPQMAISASRFCSNPIWFWARSVMRFFGELRLSLGQLLHLQILDAS